MDLRDSNAMHPVDRPIAEGVRAIIIEQAAQPEGTATFAESLARLLRRWKPALAAAIMVAAAAGAWEYRRAGRIQGVTFTVIRPSCDTPSMPAAADLSKAINSMRTPEWNVPGGRGAFAARLDKATNSVELSFTPAAVDDSTVTICRAEADRLVDELNRLVEGDMQRARLMFDATIAALDASIAEVTDLARIDSGNKGDPDTILLTRQANDLRAQRATQVVARDLLRGARILGTEAVVRRTSIASPPVTGAIAGCVAFAVALFAIAFASDVAAAYRAGSVRNP